MEKIKRILTDVYFSLPIRLVFRQLQSHKGLLVFWLLLLAIVAGWVGKGFGGPFLFLEPEYLGEENFWSLFMVGSGLGAFLFAYTITLFINESYRFHFIALVDKPFYTFFLNSLIIPGIFLLVYFITFIQYHVSLEGGFSMEVFSKVAGLSSGILVVLLLSASYFFAQRTFLSWLGKKVEKKIVEKKSGRGRWVLLGKARESLRTPQRTDYYLSFPLKVSQVQGVPKKKLGNILKSINQHHGKLLLMQILTFSLIAFLGLVEGNTYFQIPAGASFLLVISLLMLIFGAVTFWFRRMGIAVFFIGLLSFYGLNTFSIFEEQNQAFGLNYEVEPADYTPENLACITQPEIMEQDREHTIASLNHWKRSYQEKYGKDVLPKAIFVNASGGGLRSAFWTFRIMQELDTLSDGKFMDEVRLMSGASGGMFGLSYFRELYWQKEQGWISSLQEDQYAQNISKDLLNRVVFKTFSDIFLPSQRVKVDGKSYFKEAGYSFDHQLSKNLPELANRKLGDYTDAEARGQIPLLILEPTILNQGRKLYISSSPVSFLSKGHPIASRYSTRSSGIEFQKLFKEQEAEELYMTTALRMNASFPLVNPLVELPSEPIMQVMDAGAIDNYGTQTAVKFLFEFKDWFAENTEGVLFIQIRDHGREDPIYKPKEAGLIGKWLRPIGGSYFSMFEAKDMANDYLLEYISQWYDGQIDVVPMAYDSHNPNERASLSWHLTQREKLYLEENLHATHNKEAFAMMQEVFDRYFLASGKRP